MTLFEHRFEHVNYAEGPQTGEPFVLLHGGGGRWQNGATFLELLAGEGWHVYAPDLRGHGRSGHVPGAYNLSDYVGDLVRSWNGLWPCRAWSSATLSAQPGGQVRHGDCPQAARHAARATPSNRKGRSRGYAGRSAARR